MLLDEDDGRRITFQRGDVLATWIIAGLAAGLLLFGF